jgi:hypothetical protein
MRVWLVVKYKMQNTQKHEAPKKSVKMSLHARDNNNGFRDVSILTQESTNSKHFDLYVQLAMKLRELNPRFHFEFAPISGSRYVLLDSEVRKTFSDWSVIVASDRPLSRKTNYFELELIADHDLKLNGMVVGVSEARVPNVDLFTPKCRSCHIYDGRNTSLMTQGVKHIKNEDCKRGDVIGVVVDFTQDQILFYLNGKLLAVNTEDRKPSMFPAIYLLCATYYAKTGVAVVKKYDYEELPKFYKIGTD